ncbi:hypothetical protein ANN_04409 [Periplaneta americana]|uniref:Uncharacterized protein n=1 Tax=Periplaneta americana TaxID=6978 RepID=A0ABQ8TA06_PERAM|nr:hypothetical protein ANN_04409 [Periplaneta americana]
MRISRVMEVHIRNYLLYAYQRIPNFTGPVDNDVTLQRNRNKTAGRIDGCHGDCNKTLFFFTWLINDAVSTTKLFSVDVIGDTEMIFGEMRSRIHHRYYLIFALQLGKTSKKTQSDGHTRRHFGIQELAGETVDDRGPDGGRLQVAARRTVDQNRTPKNTVEGESTNFEREQQPVLAKLWTKN